MLRASPGPTDTLVELVRVTLLAPMVFVLALMHAKHVPTGNTGGQKLAIHYARQRAAHCQACVERSRYRVRATYKK